MPGAVRYYGANNPAFPGTEEKQHGSGIVGAFGCASVPGPARIIHAHRNRPRAQVSCEFKTILDNVVGDGVREHPRIKKNTSEK
jgi:hypothetical protein